MPIEEPYELEKAGGDLVPQAPIFAASNVIVAGTIKVKHPLLAETLLLIGFVVGDSWLNFEKCKVNGMHIQYKYNETNFTSVNDIIYIKLIVDSKKHHFSHYFKQDEVFNYRSRRGSGDYKKYVYDDSSFNYLHNNLYSLSGYPEKFDYYLYEKTNSEIPECVSDEVYAVCRYIKDDTFKYALFSFHELMPE